MKEIIVLHEFGAPEHFRGLVKAQEQCPTEYSIKFVEFRVIKNIIKGILHHDIKQISKNIINIGSIIKLLFSNNKIIILGMAPYDGFVIVARLLQCRHEIVYYSSWPYWDHQKYPKHVWFANHIVDKSWELFLQKVRFVGVIKEGVKNFKTQNDCVSSWVIPHSIDPSIYYPVIIENNVEVLRVVFVGRLIPEKGIKTIIDVITSELIDDGFRFTFIGDGDEGLKKEIIDLSKTLSNVIYKEKINNQHEIATEYRNSDIILLPSIRTEKWEELFGMVLIEAMACGNVPISTPCIGPKSIITDKMDGFFVKEGDIGGIVEILNNLKKDRSMLNEMKKHAINTSKEYTVSSCSKKWIDVLDSL